jgi:hypothetical protein
MADIETVTIKYGDMELVVPVAHAARIQSEIAATANAAGVDAETLLKGVMNTNFRKGAGFSAFFPTVSVDILSAALMTKRLTTVLEDDLKIVENKLAEQGAKYMRSIAPYKTGDFYNSVEADGSTIKASVPLAMFLNNGTRPHIITPSNAKCLVFHPANSSLLVFTTIVHHPGTKPTYIIDNTIKYIEDNKEDILEAEL